MVLYFVIKNNLEIIFQNGPEYESTSLKEKCSVRNLFDQWNFSIAKFSFAAH